MSFFNSFKIDKKCNSLGNKYIIILFLFFIKTNYLIAQNITISGEIHDKATGELLSNVSIIQNNSEVGTISNSYGFFSIQVSRGKQILTASHIGYNDLAITISVESDTVINFSIEKKYFVIDEVIIKSNTNKNRNSIAGLKLINGKDLINLPNFMGEPDVLKFIQNLPGINTSHQGTTNLSVKGGSNDQNLIVIDEAPIYNPSHALNFFSILNSDAVREIKVVSGYFPAKYGGRLSSIIEIMTREGSFEKTEASIGLGLISSRILLSTPLLKNKVAFIFSSRVCYAGAVLNSFGNIGKAIGFYSLKNFESNKELRFYDYSSKINFKLTEKTRVYLSTFSSKDHLYFESLINSAMLNWRNSTSTLRINNIISSKMFNNTTFYLSNYHYSYLMNDETINFEWKSKISEYGFKSDFDYYLTANSHMSFGAGSYLTVFYPGEVLPIDSISHVNRIRLDRKQSVLSFLYINNSFLIRKIFGVDLGLRVCDFFNLGPATNYLYDSNLSLVVDSFKVESGSIFGKSYRIEPRIGLTVHVSSMQDLKFSYTINNQFLHYISNSTIGLPTDIWLPSNRYLKPQKANQLSFESITNFKKGYNISFEMYFKNLVNVSDFIDNSFIFLNKYIETQIRSGNGNSYGFSLALEKNYGKFKSNCSYFFSKTRYKIENINLGRPYSPSWDIRNNFNISVNYNLGDKLELSSLFKITSGGFITMPIGFFNFYGSTFSVFTKRNGYQLPNYIRWDFQVRKGIYSSRNMIKGEMVFSIINVLGRKNVFSTFSKQSGISLNEIRIFYIYLHTIVPSFTLNISLK
ncbi:MAG: carboxypeptidase-like regulatory domain-containing protein [Bacteroidales bacterium]